VTRVKGVVVFQNWTSQKKFVEKFFEKIKVEECEEKIDERIARHRIVKAA
jgi:hypothetical protein